MLRKGMHIIEHEGYENDKKFTEALRNCYLFPRVCAQLTIWTDCQLQVATGVLKHLKEKGFLIHDDVSKKASRNKSQARLSAVKTGSLRLAMLQEYFDPLVNVAHHVRGRAFTMGYYQLISWTQVWDTGRFSSDAKYTLWSANAAAPSVLGCEGLQVTHRKRENTNWYPWDATREGNYFNWPWPKLCYKRWAVPITKSC